MHTIKNIYVYASVKLRFLKRNLYAKTERHVTEALIGMYR